jgi:hypothetical protein
VISILSNPILSPLSSVYMILALLSCLVPPLSYIAVLFGDAIVSIAGSFSRIPGAMVSLEYSFAAPIIIIMTLAIALMLIIRLKRKWIILIPPAAGVIVFSICLAVHTVMLGNSATVDYYFEDKNELFVISEGNSAVICDMSNGAYSFMKSGYTLMSDRCVTEISDVVLTHYHALHPASLEKIFKRSIVRRACLPYPKDSREIDAARDIAGLCESYGVELYIYRDSESFEVGKSIRCAFYREEIRDDGAHPSLCAVIGGESETIAYISSESHTGTLGGVARTLASECDNIIFGYHGRGPKERYSYDISPGAESIFYACRELYALSDIKHGDTPVYLPPSDEIDIPYILVLD